VDGSVLVEFTNLKPVPIMIAAYMVETQLTNGQWKAVETVVPGSLTHGKLFTTQGDDDLQSAREIKIATFDSVIKKDIGPMETVRGWLTFKQWPAGNIRFELRDAKTGLVSVQPFTPSIRQDFSVAGGAWPVQAELYEIPTNVEDISQCGNQ
jgi:hypothetical protein